MAVYYYIIYNLTSYQNHSIFLIPTSGMTTASVSAGLSGQEKKKCLWVGFDESVPITSIFKQHK